MNDVAMPSPAHAPACPQCGAVARPPRLTLRWLLRRAREDVFGLERGLLPTFGHLLVAPRRVVEAYLHGAPPRYYGPFKYFLVATALSLLLMPGAPFFDQGFAQLAARTLALPPEQALDFVQRWNAVLYAPLVLLLAAMMRGFFRARGLNFAEHLVLVLYGWSQMVLLGTFSLLVVAGFKALDIRGVVLMPLLLVAPAYWFWFVGNSLRLRSLPDWLRAFAALPGALAGFLLAFTFGLRAIAPLVALVRGWIG